jgi:dihydroneopterin aldolase
LEKIILIVPEYRMNSSAERDDLKHATHTRLCLRDLYVTMSIGVHPWEKHPERPQRVRVDAMLYVRGTEYLYAAAKGGPIVNYETVRRHVLGWPGLGHVDYIETLMTGLLEACFSDARVEACDVSIMKPDIFTDAREAGVEVFMTRVDYLKAQKSSA